MAPDKRGSGRKGEINAVTQETLASICGEQCSFVFAGIQLRSTEWAGSALARLWRQCPILPYQGPAPPPSHLHPHTPSPHLPCPRQPSGSTFPPSFLLLGAIVCNAFPLSLATGSAGMPVPELGRKPRGREGGITGGCAVVTGEESARFSSRIPAGALKCNNTSRSRLFLHSPPAPLPLSWAEEGPPVSGHGAPDAPLDTFFAQTEQDNGGKRSPVFGTVQTRGAQSKKKLGGEMKGLCLPLSGGVGTRETLLERWRQRARETETGVDVRAPGVT